MAGKNKSRDSSADEAPTESGADTGTNNPAATSKGTKGKKPNAKQRNALPSEAVQQGQGNDPALAVATAGEVNDPQGPNIDRHSPTEKTTPAQMSHDAEVKDSHNAEAASVSTRETPSRKKKFQWQHLIWIGAILVSVLVAIIRVPTPARPEPCCLMASDIVALFNRGLTSLAAEDANFLQHGAASEKHVHVRRAVIATASTFTNHVQNLTLLVKAPPATFVTPDVSSLQAFKDSVSAELGPSRSSCCGIIVVPDMAAMHDDVASQLKSLFQAGQVGGDVVVGCRTMFVGRVDPSDGEKPAYLPDRVRHMMSFRRLDN